MLGPYSRDGWNHFGPAMYYLLAIPYRLTGSRSIGMFIGALIINAVALGGIAIIAWRRGGLPVLAITALGLSIVMHALGAEFLRDPWNPYVTVLPFGLLVFLIWELSAAQTWALPASAAVATFLVQTHVGYVPLAVPLFLGGAVWLLLATRRQIAGTATSLVNHPALRRAAIVTALILVVMWLPPLIGVIRHTPGNLATAIRSLLDGKSTHTLPDGFRVLSQQLSTAPEWVTGAKAQNPFSGEPSSLLPHVRYLGWPSRSFWRCGCSGGVASMRRCASRAIIVVTWGLGILTVARTIGPLYVYRLRWTYLLGMLAMVFVAWAVWVAVTQLSMAWPRRLLGIPIAAAIVVFSVVNTTERSPHLYAAEASVGDAHQAVSSGC